MSDFRKLKVWRKAHELMLDVHALTRDIRGPAYFALKSQIVRAAMSIPANIVEGRSQRTEKDFSRFLGYAKSSSSELEYHLVAAVDLDLLANEKTKPIIDRVVEVRKMLIGLQQTLCRPAVVPLL
jgi:four helix bundle protein